MIDPAKVCLYVPGNLKKFKLDLFNRIAAHIEALSGKVIRSNWATLDQLPNEIIPVVGCHPECRPLIAKWREKNRPWIYWDRGYVKRWFAAGLPKPATIEESFYRWHLNGFQMQSVRDVPGDRLQKLSQPLRDWRRSGKHIVIAATSKTYNDFHGTHDWLEKTLDTLARITGRQLVIRHKEQVLTRQLDKDLDGAHCLVTHGSNAAVESVILGCPVFVHPESAAALMGKTDLSQIEKPDYPAREAWMSSLAYAQFNERELVDGTLWRLLQ